MAGIDSQWHKGPTMRATGSFDWSVSGTTISVWGNVSNGLVYSGSYGYNVTGYISIGGANVGGFQVTSGSPSGSCNFSGSRDAGAGDFEIQIHLCCGQTGGCSGGYNDVVVGSAWVHVDNPSRPATNVSDGAIYSNGNSGGVHKGTIMDWDSSQIWFDWWGQSSGYPWENEISHYNVDCNKVNDINSAGSCTETDHYVQNTRINISTLMSRYSMNRGDTLYCWVNTCLNSGAWLGRQYLGAITIYSPAKIVINSISPSPSVVIGNNLSVNYTISGGNTAIDWASLKVYDSSGNLKKNVSFSNRKARGTYTDVVNIDSSTFKYGGKYQVAARCSDNWQELESGKTVFYTNPKHVSTINISSDSVRPDTTVSLSWSGATGSNSEAVSSYSIDAMKYTASTKTWSSWTSKGGTQSGTSKTFRPKDWYSDIANGDKIRIRIGVKSSYEIWDDNNRITKDITIYKRGKLMYKDSSGVWHECTKLYDKDNSGNLKSCSYVQAKDSSGIIHTIDIIQ